MCPWCKDNDISPENDNDEWICYTCGCLFKVINGETIVITEGLIERED